MKSLSDTSKTTVSVASTATDETTDKPSAAASSPKENCDSEAAITATNVRGKPSACVFVASLCSNKSDDQLCVSVTNHFKQWGKLSTVKVLRDTSNRPYAFVQYTTDEECKTAIKNGHNAVLDGRTLRCEAAKVNRTLFLNFGLSMSADSVKQALSKYGEIEEVLPAFSSGVVLKNHDGMSFHWYIKFVYRDDAIAAFASLTADTKYDVDWAQNVDGATPVNNSFDKFSIFVGQLSSFITEEELKQRFSRHGTVTHISVVKKPTNTFAFIKYEQEASAARAVEVENHSMFMDRTIHVQYKEHHNKSVPNYGRFGPNNLKSADREIPKSIALAPPPINVIKKGYERNYNGSKPRRGLGEHTNYSNSDNKFHYPQQPMLNSNSVNKENATSYKIKHDDDKEVRSFVPNPKGFRASRPNKMSGKRFNSANIPYYYYVPDTSYPEGSYSPGGSNYGGYSAPYYYVDYPMSPTYMYYGEN